ncbi:MAG: CcdB family protein [Parvularculaceae bacterium]
MARFDVYQTSRATQHLVVDVQANLLSDLATRVVVPLSPQNAKMREALPRLNPVMTVAGKEYVFQTREISPLPAAMLRNPVANLEAEYRNEITGALDFLFQGF